MLLPLLLWACAAPLQSTTDLGALQPPDALAQVYARQDPQALLEEAQTRRVYGDLDGAVERYAWLAQTTTDPELVLEALVQLGITHELQGELVQAIEVYSLLLGRTEDPRWRRDVGFRRALCLEELGRYDEALDQYNALTHLRELNATDQTTLELAVGVATLRGGQARKGRRTLERVLAQPDRVAEIPWMAAKAWYNLEVFTLEQAALLDLTSAREAPKQLKERAGLILEAEAQLVHVVELGQPDFILAGLLALGDAYVGLAQDLAASPPPDKLNPEAAAIYTQALSERTRVLHRKAWEAYDQGLVVAGRFGMLNDTTAALQARRDAVPVP